MQRRRLLGAVSVLFLAAATVVDADRTDDFVKARMDAFRLPGLSLVVVKDGRIVKAAAYGLADVERKISATPDTIFKIGSVSKQFVAVGIMVLVQDGRLGLDSRIGKFLDDAPATWKAITIRHLLTHTSGLTRESPGFSPFKVQSDAALIRAAYSAPLAFPPGTRWQYSNLGYVVLAEIIAKVSERPWSDFLHEKVFEPAGMDATTPKNVRTNLAPVAVGYTGDNNSRPAQDWPGVRAGGAYLSTVLDLAKWDAALNTDKVLSEKTRRAMWTPVRLSDGTTAPYGFGWHVYPRGRRRVWHGGGLPGFSAYLARFLDDRLTVAVLTNGDDVDTASIATGLARLYLAD